ncbi:hypothetical protein C8J57DRAFT_1515890 [Mycena rebaudengoi]|nr:hypothetical protein C8J57DRAFT_1515890 [Mycena rebaudengoi]
MSKTAGEFQSKSNGSRAKTCLVCQRRNRDAARNKKAYIEKENAAPMPDVDADDEADYGSLGLLPLGEFLDAVTQQDDNLDLEARVDISSASGDRRGKADQLAASIWNRMKYRFVANPHATPQRAMRTHAPGLNPAPNTTSRPRLPPPASRLPPPASRRATHLPLPPPHRPPPPAATTRHHRARHRRDAARAWLATHTSEAPPAFLPTNTHWKRCCTT